MRTGPPANIRIKLHTQKTTLADSDSPNFTLMFACAMGNNDSGRSTIDERSGGPGVSGGVRSGGSW
eukprot:3714607-Alexandrium_andersonii.AAC.1